MNYFKDCKTIHEAKQKFRELAKKHHPDAGGDTKTFAEISRQMDAFTPSQPEHSNFFGNGGGWGGRTTYTYHNINPESFFKQYSHLFSIPFDHPIHEEKRTLEKQLREANENARYFENKYEESCKLASDYMLELERAYFNMAQKREEIASLQSQIEVLSRPKPATSMLDKIRSFFEKSS